MAHAKKGRLNGCGNEIKYFPVSVQTALSYFKHSETD